MPALGDYLEKIDLIVSQPSHPHSRSIAVRHLAQIVAWLLVSLFALDTLSFVWRTTNPVIEADAWYFLDVFLRKAIDGDLEVWDFFVKRGPGDHAQPLFKILMLLNWLYFDLDFALDSVVGFMAAATCALIYHRLLIPARFHVDSNAWRCLAWAAICAVLLSLNSTGVWTWSLVALENVTSLIVLLFVLATWHAHRRQRYLLLAFATLLLGISSDDSALVAAFSVCAALLFVLLRDPAQRHASAWKVFAVIGACMVVVRVGYGCLPYTGFTFRAHLPTAAKPATISFEALYEALRGGGWWQWILLPLTLPVYYRNPFGPAYAFAWGVAQGSIGVALLVAHVQFWRQASCCRYNPAAFSALGLMLVTYGWTAGIIFFRVSKFGNDYLNQPRYVLFYAGHLIALILMWAATLDQGQGPAMQRFLARVWIPAAGCLILLVATLPQSFAAWHSRKYDIAYYADMARQINVLAHDPINATQCNKVQPVCGMKPMNRADLVQLMSTNGINVFSPRVQRRHAYLPPLLHDARAPQ